MNSTVTSIVDRHLQLWLDKGLNKLPMAIEQEMADPTQDKKEQWRRWFPIAAKVTPEEIVNFELQIGHLLPKGYKDFLQHKHFYSLHISEVSFFAHPVKTWNDNLISQIMKGYKKQFLIDKGYIPFAEYTDWGLLCFDTSNGLIDEEYRIVLWDHENPSEFKHLYLTFEEMMLMLDNGKKNIS